MPIFDAEPLRLPTEQNVGEPTAFWPSTELVAGGDALAARLKAVPKFVALPPRELKAGKEVSRFETKQLWEGTVTRVTSDSFTAVLADKTNPGNPDEEAVFTLSEISDEERRFIKDGSSFYWTLGIERTPAGQHKNVSIVQFRRLPTWTKGALGEASESARRLRELFKSGE